MEILPLSILLQDPYLYRPCCTEMEERPILDKLLLWRWFATLQFNKFISNYCFIKVTFHFKKSVNTKTLKFYRKNKCIDLDQFKKGALEYPLHSRNFIYLSYNEKAKMYDTVVFDFFNEPAPVITN